MAVGASRTVGATDAAVKGCVIGGAAAAEGELIGIESVLAVGACATVGATDAVVTGSVMAGAAAAEKALIGIA